MLSLVCLTLFVAAKLPEIKPIDVKVTSSNDAQYIAKYIGIWSKLGYKVHSLTPQSVSTSITQYYGRPEYRDIKGDLILIMTK